MTNTTHRKLPSKIFAVCDVESDGLSMISVFYNLEDAEKELLYRTTYVNTYKNEAGERIPSHLSTFFKLLELEIK
jgi:hypothetical protein